MIDEIIIMPDDDKDQITLYYISSVVIQSKKYIFPFRF